MQNHQIKELLFIRIASSSSHFFSVIKIEQVRMGTNERKHAGQTDRDENEERRMKMKKWLQMISVLFLSSFVLMGCNNDQDENNDNNAPDVEENDQDHNGNNQDTDNNNVPGVDEDDTINQDDENDNEADPEDPVEDAEDTDKDKKDE